MKGLSTEATEILAKDPDVAPGDDFETALADPSAYYHDPDAIVADDTLNLAQKKRFLAEWEQDLADHQTASGEGMTVQDAKGELSEAADAELLRRVQHALKQLESSFDSDEGFKPRRWWQRLGAA